MFNKQVAVFLSGFKSRAEIDRYEIRHARKLIKISHAFRTFLLRTKLTEEDMALCSRAFRMPKMFATPKSTRAVKK